MPSRHLWFPKPLRRKQRILKTAFLSVRSFRERTILLPWFDRSCRIFPGPAWKVLSVRLASWKWASIRCF